MDLPGFSFSLRISNSILLLLLGFFLFRIKDIRAKLGIFFILGILSFLLLPILIQVNASLVLKIILFGFISSLTFFFWILSVSIFQDDFEFKKWHWILLGLKIIASFSLFIFRSDLLLNLESIEKMDFVAFLPNILISQTFVVVAIIQTYAGRKIDLVESRRVLREYHIVLSGSGIIWIIFSPFIFRPKFPEYTEFTNLVLTLFLICIFYFLALEFKKGLFFEKIETKEEPVTIDLVLQNKLIQIFEKEKLYHMEGLTIRILADKMGEYEYKVRRLINQGLGFKNFNDFLNRYRIQEACEILLDKSKSDTPIIRIAMDIGYTSLGPFNKAFKEITGTTPSEFRKKS